MRSQCQLKIRSKRNLFHGGKMLKTENNRKSSHITAVKDNRREDEFSWAKAGLQKMFSSPTKKIDLVLQTNIALEKRIKNFSVLPFAEGIPDNFFNKEINTNYDNKEENNTDVQTNQQVNSGKVTKKISKRNLLTVSADREELCTQISLASLFNSVFEGITVGIFLETALWGLSFSPLAQLSIGTSPFDSFLAKYLEIERPFTLGILFGTMGGLIKTCLDMDNGYQILLVIGAVLSILPGNKKIEKLQLIFQALLMLLLFGRGLMTTVDLSRSYLTKTPEMTKSFTKKITNTITSVSFFSKKETENTENNIMDAGTYFQPYTKACH